MPGKVIKYDPEWGEWTLESDDAREGIMSFEEQAIRIEEVPLFQWAMLPFAVDFKVEYGKPRDVHVLGSSLSDAFSRRGSVPPSRNSMENPEPSLIQPLGMESTAVRENPDNSTPLALSPCSLDQTISVGASFGVGVAKKISEFASKVFKEDHWQHIGDAPLFGMEMTLGNRTTIANEGDSIAKAQAELIGALEKATGPYKFSKNSKGEFSVLTVATPPEGEEAKQPEPLWTMSVLTDQGVLEIPGAPFTLSDLGDPFAVPPPAKCISSILREVLKAAKTCKLQPQVYVGGGHVHMDMVRCFKANPRLFLNFFVDVQNNPETYSWVLGAAENVLLSWYPGANAPATYKPLQDIIEFYGPKIDEFEKGTFKDPLAKHAAGTVLIRQIAGCIHRYCYTSAFYKSRRDKPRLQGINVECMLDEVKGKDTLEMRCFRPHQGARHLQLVIKLLQQHLTWASKQTGLLDASWTVYEIEPAENKALSDEIRPVLEAASYKYQPKDPNEHAVNRSTASCVKADPAKKKEIVERYVALLRKIEFSDEQIKKYLTLLPPNFLDAAVAQGLMTHDEAHAVFVYWDDWRGANKGN